MAPKGEPHFWIMWIQKWGTAAGGQGQHVAGTWSASIAERTIYIASMAAASAVGTGSPEMRVLLSMCDRSSTKAAKMRSYYSFYSSTTAYLSHFGVTNNTCLKRTQSNSVLDQILVLMVKWYVLFCNRERAIQRTPTTVVHWHTHFLLPQTCIV